MPESKINIVEYLHIYFINIYYTNLCLAISLIILIKYIIKNKIKYYITKKIK